MQHRGKSSINSIMGRFRKDWLSTETALLVLLLLLRTNTLSVASNRSIITDTDTEQERLVALHIIAIVPTTDGASLSPTEWEQGEEILSGAYQAASEVGNSIHGYRLEVIPVRVLQCDLNMGIIPFVEELISKESHIIVGIVGYFCHNIAKHFSELLHRSETEVVQISAISLDKARVPHIRHALLPISESTARALVQLVLRLGWSKVAVISGQNINFLDVKHAFLKQAKEQGIKVISQLEISQSPHSSHKDYLKEIRNTGAKIIVGFLPQYEVVDALCTAYHHGFRWPHYAWIFTDPTIVDKIPYYNFKFTCSHNRAADTINGAIFLSIHLGNFHSSSNGLNNVAYPNDSLNLSDDPYLWGNSYANVLYDSVRAIVLALNGSLHMLSERNLSLTGTNISSKLNPLHARSDIIELLEKQVSQLSFQGTTGFLNFSHGAAAMQITVELFQFQNQQPVHIGSYNYSDNHLILNRMIIGEIPTDSLNRIYILYPTYVTVILLTIIIACFVLITISMCLYFYYHKHPSIKATSSTLSLCLFIGCYFLLLSSLFYTINSGIIRQTMGMSYRILSCMFDIYLTNVGIDIVLATVIAKTLRIYHIFKKYGKVHQICSDRGLLILISAIVSVKIILLIFQTCLDISIVVDRELYIKESIPPYFLVTQKCQSRYSTVWISLQYLYTLMLTFVMVLLAVLTRKIKRGDFKDTKKINMLVGALVFDLCIFLPLWAILRLIDDVTLSRVAYTVGTTLAAFLCQAFMILPKIVPLVVGDCRCLKTLKSYVSTQYFTLTKTLDSKV